MEIWHAPLDLATLNAASEGTAMRHLGIVFTAFGPDWIEASMPVDHRTMQPFKLLHGGASVLLAETLGSMAANACRIIAATSVWDRKSTPTTCAACAAAT